MLVLELCLGQQLQRGCLHSFITVHPTLKGLGIACTAIGSFAITVYFAVVLSWSERYIIGSTGGDLPWGRNATTALQFFQREIIYSTKNTDFNWMTFVGLVILYTCVCFAVWRGVHTLQYSMYFTFLPMCVFFFVLTIVALILPGSEKGLAELFTPRTEFFSLQLWTDAIGQAFLTLAVGCGTMVTFGSHNTINHNTVKYSIVIVLIQLMFSLCCGICTFSVLGSTTTAMNASVTTTTNSATSAIANGLHLPFIVYPLILSQLPIPQVFSFLFFFWLFVLGVGVVSGPMQTVHTVLRDKFTHAPSFVLSAVACLTSTILGLPFCFGSGYFLVVSVDIVVVGMCLPMHVFFECIGIGYMWGERSVTEEVRERGHHGARKVADYCSVGFHHGIARIRELLAAVEKLNVDPYVFPILVKIIIPLASLLTVFSSLVVLVLLYREDAFQISPWNVFLPTLLPFLSCVIIWVEWVRAPPQAEQKAPWSNDMLAVEMQFSKDTIVAVAT
jgi:SNF family Na+-dependent transporter